MSNLPSSEVSKSAVDVNTIADKEQADQLKFQALLAGLKSYKAMAMECETNNEKMSDEKLKNWHLIYDEINRFWKEEGESSSDMEYRLICGMIEHMKPPCFATII